MACAHGRSGFFVPSPLSVPDRGKQSPSAPRKSANPQIRRNAGCVAGNAHEANREKRRQRGGGRAETRSFGRPALTRPRPQTAPALAFRAKKIPTDKGWDWFKWWRRRELNPRPKALRAQRYMLSSPFDLVLRQHGEQSAPQDQPLGFGSCRKAPASSDPVIMTLHPRAQAQVGSGLGLKRPERRRRRSRLGFLPPD